MEEKVDSFSSASWNQGTFWLNIMNICIIIEAFQEGSNGLLTELLIFTSLQVLDQKLNDLMSSLL
jgi:hypothetical protein